MILLLYEKEKEIIVREEMMLTLNEVTEILRQNKKKVTPQRLAVYAALAATREHPTAEALYKELRPNYPTMSLATVYKSLDAFCEIGIVQELNVGEEAFRYDADISQHPHVRCVGCDKVVDVPIAALPALDKNVSSITGYRVIAQQMYFFGYCPACQKSMVGDL